MLWCWIKLQDLGSSWLNRFVILFQMPHRKCYGFLGPDSPPPQPSPCTKARSYPAANEYEAWIKDKAGRKRMGTIAAFRNSSHNKLRRNLISGTSQYWAIRKFGYPTSFSTRGRPESRPEEFHHLLKAEVGWARSLPASEQAPHGSGRC